jgi:uncharacterized phosphosugar-binding protein
MDVTCDYLNFVIKKLKEVQETQLGRIKAAAEMIAQSYIDGGNFYIFGTGHSHMIAEEIYIRAGGFAPVKAILEPALMLHEMPNKSTYLERLSGYAASLIKLYKINCKDTLMVISNSGRNPLPVEMVLEAKKLGCKVIVLTSLKHSSKVTSRHSSGLRLFEAADITIDNCADFGDAAYTVPGTDTPTGATSDITGTAIAQALIVSTVEILVTNGIVPPLFKSSNVDGADEYNQTLFDTYFPV